MGKAITIGITGGTCSGKTTLARMLQLRLSDKVCTHLAMDDFYKQQPADALEEGTADFDRPDAFEIDLFIDTIEDLRQGLRVEIPNYDRKTSTIVGTKLIYPKPMLVVDGLFLLFDKRVSDLLDLSVFLDIDPATQFSRRLKRDVEEYALSADLVRKTYDTKITPSFTKLIEPTRDTANLVLAGTDNVNCLVDECLSGVSTTNLRSIGQTK